MRYLGTANWVLEQRAGAQVRSLDLRPWGGPLWYLGPVSQPLPAMSRDFGSVRAMVPTRAVYELAPGDPAPTIGLTGVAGGPLLRVIKLLPWAALAVGGFFVWRWLRR